MVVTNIMGQLASNATQMAMKKLSLRQQRELAKRAETERMMALVPEALKMVQARQMKMDDVAEQKRQFGESQALTRELEDNKYLQWLQEQQTSARKSELDTNLKIAETLHRGGAPVPRSLFPEGKKYDDLHGAFGTLSKEAGESRDIQQDAARKRVEQAAAEIERIKLAIENARDPMAKQALVTNLQLAQENLKNAREQNRILTHGTPFERAVRQAGPEGQVPIPGYPPPEALPPGFDPMGTLGSIKGMTPEQADVTFGPRTWLTDAASGNVQPKDVVKMVLQEGQHNRNIQAGLVDDLMDRAEKIKKRHTVEASGGTLGIGGKAGRTWQESATPDELFTLLLSGEGSAWTLLVKRLAAAKAEAGGNEDDPTVQNVDRLMALWKGTNGKPGLGGMNSIWERWASYMGLSKPEQLTDIIKRIKEATGGV